jgi:hypothetical protein
VKKIAEIEEDKPREEARKFQIISSLVCFVGGIIYVSSVGDTRVGGDQFGLSRMSGILIGIMVIIGAISGLRYRRSGPLLCFIMGLLSLACMSTYVDIYVYSELCITRSVVYLLGFIFTIGGSLVGVIGLREKKRNIV